MRLAAAQMCYDAKHHALPRGSGPRRWRPIPSWARTGRSNIATTPPAPPRSPPPAPERTTPSPMMPPGPGSAPGPRRPPSGAGRLGEGARFRRCAGPIGRPANARTLEGRHRPGQRARPRGPGEAPPGRTRSLANPLVRGRHLAGQGSRRRAVSSPAVIETPVRPARLTRGPPGHERISRI